MPPALEPPPPANMDAYHATYRKAIESLLDGDNKSARALAQQAMQINPEGIEAKRMDERLKMKGF